LKVLRAYTLSSPYEPDIPPFPEDGLFVERPPFPLPDDGAFEDTLPLPLLFPADDGAFVFPPFPFPLPFDGPLVFFDFGAFDFFLPLPFPFRVGRKVGECNEGVELGTHEGEDVGIAVVVGASVFTLVGFCDKVGAIVGADVGIAVVGANVGGNDAAGHKVTFGL